MSSKVEHTAKQLSIEKDILGIVYIRPGLCLDEIIQMMFKTPKPSGGYYSSATYIRTTIKRMVAIGKLKEKKAGKKIHIYIPDSYSAPEADNKPRFGISLNSFGIE